MNEPWRVPAGAWKGEPAFILGGGPSLPVGRINALRGHGRVIAVNNAYEIAPWADLLYFADVGWFRWNKDNLAGFPGLEKVTRQKLPRNDMNIGLVRHDKVSALSRDPGAVAGHCGGANAINLAFLHGADPIVLLGFDMRHGNWHDRHQRKAAAGVYVEKFIPAIERMATELEREGVAVLNATPGSALRCFPVVTLDDVLDRLREAA